MKDSHIFWIPRKR